MPPTLRRTDRHCTPLCLPPHPPLHPSHPPLSPRSPSPHRLTMLTVPAAPSTRSTTTAVSLRAQWRPLQGKALSSATAAGWRRRSLARTEARRRMAA
ncbi:hypothetical protein LDENG_00240650 [Lucifuga dentata]|nr:hypothetical protein LDENG_00240650 [Lucifuga dentata]